jgi:hypothetical protein
MSARHRPEGPAEGARVDDDDARGGPPDARPVGVPDQMKRAFGRCRPASSAARPGASRQARRIDEERGGGPDRVAGEADGVAERVPLGLVELRDGRGDRPEGGSWPSSLQLPSSGSAARAAITLLRITARPWTRGRCCRKARRRG